MRPPIGAAAADSGDDGSPPPHSYSDEVDPRGAGGRVLRSILTGKFEALIGPDRKLAGFWRPAPAGMAVKSPPKHRHDGASPLPLGMDWSPPPRKWVSVAPLIDVRFLGGLVVLS